MLSSTNTYSLGTTISSGTVEVVKKIAGNVNNSGGVLVLDTAVSLAATATLTWANCGHPPPYLVDAEGNLAELESPQHPALGSSNPNPNFKLTKRQLGSGERLILVTDGIIDRKMEGGGTFGVEGIKAALERAESATAASTAMAIQKGVTECWREPLQDDATVILVRA